MNRPARTILLIAYNYPPSSAVGTQRTVRFMKYLPEFGWTPAVLTVRAEDLDDAIGTSAETETPGVRVHRARVVRPMRLAARVRNRLKPPQRSQLSPRGASPTSTAARGGESWVNRWLAPWFSTPDEQIGWWPAAIIEGRKAIRELNGPVLYTTSPPHSTHLIGLGLKRLTGRPWIADFRDPWSRRPWMTARQRQGLRHRLLVRLEKAVVTTADRVLLNTENMAREFRQAYPHLPPSHFVGLTNGYDPDEIGRFPVAGAAPSGPFVLLHAGTLYRRRTPLNLLRALALLRDRRLVSPDTIRVDFLGSVDPALNVDATVGELRLEDLVRFLPPVPREASHRAVAAADALLLLQPDTDLQIPGKLFDHLQFRKPFLALTTPEGATAEVVSSYKLGIVGHYSDIEDIARAILALLERRSQPLNVKAALVEFDGRRLTGKLAKLLDSVVSGVNPA